MNVLCILKYFSFSLCCYNVFGADTSVKGKIEFFLCGKSDNGLFTQHEAIRLDSEKVSITENNFNSGKGSNVLLYLKTILKNIKLTDEAKKKLCVQDLKSVPLDKIKICYISGDTGKGHWGTIVPKDSLTSREISPEQYKDVEKVITDAFYNLNANIFVAEGPLVNIYCYIEPSQVTNDKDKSNSCCCCKK